MPKPYMIFVHRFLVIKNSLSCDKKQYFVPRSLSRNFIKVVTYWGTIFQNPCQKFWFKCKGVIRLLCPLSIVCIVSCQKKYACYTVFYHKKSMYKDHVWLWYLKSLVYIYFGLLSSDTNRKSHKFGFF